MGCCASRRRLRGKQNLVKEQSPFAAQAASVGATHVVAEELSKKLALAPFAREEGEGLKLQQFHSLTQVRLSWAKRSELRTRAL